MKKKHMGRGLRALVLAGLACTPFTTALAADPPARPPVTHFTQLASIQGVAVSPSGRRIAMLVPSPEGRVRLAVMDLSPRSAPRVVAGFGDGNIAQFAWVNEDRLVFVGAMDGAETEEGGGGTFAVNHDGEGYRQLIAWRRGAGEAATGSRIAQRQLPWGWWLHSTIDDGSADVFVVRRMDDSQGDVRALSLARLNTLTGEVRRLSDDAPPGAMEWTLDAKGEPRMVVSVVGSRGKVHWRAPGASAWTQVEEVDALAASLAPSHIEPDGQVVVQARPGRDTDAWYAYDPARRVLDKEPLVAVDGFDLDAHVLRDTRTHRTLGFRFRTDRPTTYWLDDDLHALQGGIDKALPGRTNLLHCGRCDKPRFVVVHSSSDRQPGEYLLFDRERGSLELLGATRPWIDEKTQGRRTFHRVKTVDGLSMPVYVTHPAGAAADAKLPAVVLVHGGPFVRGVDLGWRAEAQFLASRGYRVIEPEFRGSTGYGHRHFKAGWKEWGHGMQDDIAAAVQWAADQGLVDGQRVCIMGASYGGYAALMGPIRHPQRYRCAVSLAAVTDIDLMYSITWGDIGERHKRYGMPEMIGDRDKDAARLREASPLERVRELKVPVLLAHGAADRRVPIDHARKFATSAALAGTRVETVYYSDEGHGWFWTKNQADFYRRVETFLDQHLGGAKP